MSADPNDKAVLPAVFTASPDQRDTLRDASGGSPDAGSTEPAAQPEASRLKQAEFTVPPQIWTRPSTGWFTRLRRAEPPGTPPAGTAIAATGAAPRRTTLLPVVIVTLLAALGLLAAWHLLARSARDAATSKATSAVPPLASRLAGATENVTQPAAANSAPVPAPASARAPDEPGPRPSTLKTPARSTAAPARSAAPAPATSDPIGPIY